VNSKLSDRISRIKDNVATQESAPEVTAEPPAEVSEACVKFVMQMVSDLDRVSANVASLNDRLCQLETVFPLCTSQIDQLSSLGTELSLLLHENEKGQSYLQDKVRSCESSVQACQQHWVDQCDDFICKTRLQWTTAKEDIQKRWDDRLENQYSKLQAIALEVAAEEIERHSSIVGCQMQALFDEVRGLRSVITAIHEESNSSAFKSLKSKWECLTLPWCATMDTTKSIATADGFSEFSASETDVLHAKPCIALGPDMGHMDIFVDDAGQKCRHVRLL
jgi:uncharacterized coiled-coil protein SlyX